MANNEQISSEPAEISTHCGSRIWNPATEEDANNDNNNNNSPSVDMNKINDFFESNDTKIELKTKDSKKSQNKDGNLVDSILENRINKIKTTQQPPHLLKSPEVLLNFLAVPFLARFQQQQRLIQFQQQNELLANNLMAQQQKQQLKNDNLIMQKQMPQFQTFPQFPSFSCLPPTPSFLMPNLQNPQFPPFPHPFQLPQYPQNSPKLPMGLVKQQQQRTHENKKHKKKPKIVKPSFKPQPQKTSTTFNPIVMAVLNDSTSVATTSSATPNATNCPLSTTTQKSEINFNTCAICGASFRITTDLVQHMRFNHRHSKYKRKNNSLDNIID